MNCLDKPKNGGPGVLRQSCDRRCCANIQARTEACAARCGDGAAPDAAEFKAKLARYVERCRGRARDVERVRVEVWKWPNGKCDAFYYGESGRRFRSIKEVALSLGLAPPKADEQAARPSAGEQAARPAPRERELRDARDHRPARACAAGAAERLAAMLDEDGEADDEAAL